MKKILITKLPVILASLTLLIVTAFLRYNLYLNSTQLAREFLTQNAKDIYSMDTLKLSSRMNSFSSALNWVCIKGEVNSTPFFNMQKGPCETGLLQQKVEIFIPEASNIRIEITQKLSKDLQVLFISFILFQIALILSIIVATKKSEEEKVAQELKFLKVSRKMFHDIRSPLASLATLSESVNFSDSTEKKIFLGSIDRINSIANSLLSQTQQIPIDLPIFQKLTPIIEEIISEKRIEFSNRKVEIIFTHNIESHALIEQQEFKRIISNLINNSVESSGKKSAQIELKISQQGAQLYLDISDNGNGIPEKILKRLGSDEISSKKSGNGLGFKEAMESMKEWNGNLEVLETSSSGTTIRLTLETKLEPIIVVETHAKNEIQDTYYLIDDDDLVRFTWEMKARKGKINLKTFNSPQLFLETKESIPKTAIIYIDSELGDTKGEDVALQLFREGFLNISITSGHPPDRFKELTFLRSVISKSVPF